MTLHGKILRVLVTNEFVRDVKYQIRFVIRRLLCFSPVNLLKIWKAKRAKDLCLNLGGGNQIFEGWTNIDLSKQKQGFRWDLRWKLPLSDQSVSRIHTEHFFDYLEYPLEALHFLQECFRVLKTEGDFRIVIADAEKYFNAYVKSDHLFFDKFRHLGNSELELKTPLEVTNQAFRLGGEHRFLYDKQTLEALLREAGFASVLAVPYAPAWYIDGPDWWRLHESMYLTAFKTPKERAQLYSSASNE